MGTKYHQLVPTTMPQKNPLQPTEISGRWQTVVASHLLNGSRKGKFFWQARDRDLRNKNALFVICLVCTVQSRTHCLFSLKVTLHKMLELFWKWNLSPLLICKVLSEKIATCLEGRISAYRLRSLNLKGSVESAVKNELLTQFSIL